MMVWISPLQNYTLKENNAAHLRAMSIWTYDRKRLKAHLNNRARAYAFHKKPPLTREGTVTVY